MQVATALVVLGRAAVARALRLAHAALAALVRLQMVFSAVVVAAAPVMGDQELSVEPVLQIALPPAVLAVTTQPGLALVLAVQQETQALPEQSVAVVAVVAVVQLVVLVAPAQQRGRQLQAARRLVLVAVLVASVAVQAQKPVQTVVFTAVLAVGALGAGLAQVVLVHKASSLLPTRQALEHRRLFPALNGMTGISQLKSLRIADG